MTEPTRDESYCDVGRHQQCSGYTEDDIDTETCLCNCHDPDCLPSPDEGNLPVPRGPWNTSSGAA